MNRMSATTFLSLYFSSKYGTRLHPANNIIQGFFVTNFIIFMLLLLCLVPFCVQLVTGHDKLHKLHFSTFFTGVFMKIHCVLKMVIGLYRVACQCRQLYAPM